MGQRRVKLKTFMAVGLRRDHFKVFFKDQRQSDAWSALERIFVAVKVVYGGMFCRRVVCHAENMSEHTPPRSSYVWLEFARVALRVEIIVRDLAWILYISWTGCS